MSAERLVVALGGNAIAGERGADPESQQRAVEEACEQIAQLVAHGHEVPEAIGAELIGRGPGLTPEGDDVVCGLAAVVASGPWPVAVREAWVAALIGSDLRRRTTSLSATLLELAARGMGPEPLQAVLGGRPSALDRLLGMGHTSGRAYARGAGVGLSVIAMRA